MEIRLRIRSEAGEIRWLPETVEGEIDRWRFNTTANPTAQAELLELAAGDMIVIEESASRHQTITLTETPTVASGIVTVTGIPDRVTGSQIPDAFADVEVTLVPGPIQGVDQTARASANAAQADVDAHEATTHNP